MIDTPEPPPGRRSRLEDEVLEILTRSDRPPSVTERSRSTVQQWTSRLRRVSASTGGVFSAPFETGVWLAGCFAMGIIAFVLRDISPFLARTFAIACFVVILLAIVRSFQQPSRRNVKQWRGRGIDISSPGRPPWIDRMLRNQRRPPKPPRR